MKRILTVLIALTITLASHAVLKEKDLPQTLHILRSELTDFHRELTEQLESSKTQSKKVRDQLFATMERSNQNALMLYSQKQDYVFDLTYACHEATEQYHEFRQQQLPFNTWMNKLNSNIARYDSLIVSLRSMPVMMLDDHAKTDRSVCLTLATNIRNNLEESRGTMKEYITFYDMTEKRLAYLNNYAQKRYNDIQTSIFRNGGDSYFSILTNWPQQWTTTMQTVTKKYQPNAKSQWDSRWILGLLVSILIYAIIATLLNYVVIHYVVPKRFRTKEFLKKQACITMATTTVTFGLILAIMLTVSQQHFFIMACGLLVNFAWLMGAILISLLLRVNGSQIKSAFRIYTPLLAVSFLVIVFRIILIPNELVNLIFPPILVLCALWQWSVIRRHNKNIPKSDMFYTYITQAVFITSVARNISLSLKWHIV